MDIVQIIMLATAAGVGFMIYKQIDSGNFQQVRKDNPSQPSQGTAAAPTAQEKIEQSKKANEQHKQQRIEELLEKTDTLVSEQNFKEAKKSIEAALILQQNSDNYMREGFILQQLDQKQDALGSYSKALEYDAHNDLAYTFMGELYTQLENYDKAAEAFENALGIDSSHGKTHLAYATMLQKAGQFQKAMQHLDKAKEYDADAQEIEQLQKEIKEKTDEKN